MTDELLLWPQAGDARLTDTRQDEQDRGITIKSTGISLYYQMSDESLKDLKVDREVGLCTILQIRCLLCHWHGAP